MARLLNDGANQYLRNLNAVVAGYPFAMVCWLYCDDTGRNSSFLGVGDVDSASIYHVLSHYGTDVRLQNTNTVQANTVATAAIVANTWHHLVGLSVTDTDHRVLLDDANRATTATEVAVGALDLTTIGCRPRAAYDWQFSGRVAEAAFYDLSLWPGATASDKTDEFERVASPALASGVSPRSIQLGLVAYCPLLRTDQDLAGSYDMTPVNGPTWADHPPQVFYSIPMWVGVPAAAAPPAGNPWYVYANQ